MVEKVPAAKAQVGTVLAKDQIEKIPVKDKWMAFDDNPNPTTPLILKYTCPKGSIPVSEGCKVLLYAEIFRDPKDPLPHDWINGKTYLIIFERTDLKSKETEITKLVLNDLQGKGFVTLSEEIIVEGVRI